MLNGHDVGRARSALSAIPPDLPREDWVRVGMAAHAAGLSIDDWTDWSRNASNFGSERECRSVWKSFKRGGVGVGTLFRLAQEHGWSDDDHSAQVPTRAPSARPTPRAAHRHVSSAPNPSAADVWSRCESADPRHPYILAKRGRASGLRQVPTDDRLRIAGHDVAGWLVLPAVTLAGQLQTLQFIPPPGTGKKLNLPGASFGDGVHVVGSLGDAARAFVVEGIGQAWACWQATGQPAVVTFGAGRIETVLQAIRNAHKQLQLVVVPDRGKEEHAQRAAAQHGAAVVTLPADRPDNFDCNDYVAELGADELEVLLSRQLQTARRYHLASADDLAKLPALRWLVRGVLPAQGLAALYGPPGSGKTFLALDLAVAVAEGVAWFGYRVKTAPVVYLGLEGEGGLAQRVNAWSTHNRRRLPDALRFIVAQPFDLLSPADIAELADAINATCGPGALVIIDTLNRAAATADENDAADMGRVIDGAKRLQVAVLGLVLLVHHAGKDITKGMRGHSSLLAAIDTAIEVSRIGSSREWRVAKAKDASDADAVGFRLEPVTLGIDEDQQPVTSCAVVVDDVAPQPSLRAGKPKGGNQRIVFDGLVDLIEREGSSTVPNAPPGRRAVTVDSAIEAVRTRLVGVDARRQPERVRAALTGLQAHGFIHVEEDWIWLP